MGQDGKALWVVLIDKSPRGPLTEEEIRLLLQQKIAHHNDLAFQVGEGNWKFLWQFDPFDRRKEPPAEELSDAIARPVKVPERRNQPPSEEQLKQKVSELLPEELSSILPEDLIVHGQTKPISPREFTEMPETSGTADAWSTNHRTWINLGIGFFLILSVGYQVWSPESSSSPREKTEREPSAVNVPRSNTETPVAKRPMTPPHSQGLPQTPTVRATVPKERDTGEIPLDDYVKRREERWEKERKEEEERYKAQLKEEDEEEKNLAKEDKKGSKKSRKVDSEEHVEGGEENAGAVDKESEEHEPDPGDAE